MGIIWAGLTFAGPSKKPADMFSCRTIGGVDGRHATQKAFHELKTRSLEGDVDATLRVGKYYLKGLCYMGTQNVRSRPGYVEGNIAALYYVMEPDCVMAQKYLAIAAKAGNQEAIELLEKPESCK